MNDEQEKDYIWRYERDNYAEDDEIENKRRYVCMNVFVL